MPRRLTIGLIGDRSDTVIAHRAIPPALALAAREIDAEVSFEWVSSEGALRVERLAHFDGLWVIPGSPYRSMEGVLAAVRYARERERPFLGTCGGFQHAVIEYARNVLQWHDADHAESSPDAECTVISALTCGLLRRAALAPGNTSRRRLWGAAHGRGISVQVWRESGVSRRHRERGDARGRRG